MLFCCLSILWEVIIYMSSCRLIADNSWANLEQEVLQASQSNYAAFLAWLCACMCSNKLAQAGCRRGLWAAWRPLASVQHTLPHTNIRSQDLDERASRRPTGMLSCLSKLVIPVAFVRFNKWVNRITKLRLILTFCDRSGDCNKYFHKPLKGICALVFKKSRLLFGSLSSLML